jgi:hypothetical protein
MQYRIQPQPQPINWLVVLQTISLLLAIAVSIRTLDE